MLIKNFKRYFIGYVCSYQFFLLSFYAICGFLLERYFNSEYFYIGFNVFGFILLRLFNYNPYILASIFILVMPAVTFRPYVVFGNQDFPEFLRISLYLPIQVLILIEIFYKLHSMILDKIRVLTCYVTIALWSTLFLIHILLNTQIVSWMLVLSDFIVILSAVVLYNYFISSSAAEILNEYSRALFFGFVSLLTMLIVDFFIFMISKSMVIQSLSVSFRGGLQGLLINDETLYSYLSGIALIWLFVINRSFIFRFLLLGVGFAVAFLTQIKTLLPVMLGCYVVYRLSAFNTFVKIVAILILALLTSVFSSEIISNYPTLAVRLSSIMLAHQEYIYNFYNMFFGIAPGVLVTNQESNIAVAISKLTNLDYLYNLPNVYYYELLERFSDMKYGSAITPHIFIAAFSFSYGVVGIGSLIFILIITAKLLFQLQNFYNSSDSITIKFMSIFCAYSLFFSFSHPIINIPLFVSSLALIMKNSNRVYDA